MGDHHVVALEKEMGVQIEETREVSLVVGNFLETIINFPVSTSGNYQALNNSSLTLFSEPMGKYRLTKFAKNSTGGHPDLHSMHLILNASRRNGGIGARED